nr:N,N-dimethylformamidase beta subunit family domain-containing protein [Rhodopseudomonas sp. B29]
MKAGTPESVWLIDQADSSIEGFSAQFTVDHGQRVDFKINTDATNYRVDIYRLGYYGGDGARLVTSFTQNLATAQVQPAPLFDPATKLVDAGNWAVSASWDIPADATSGIYFAELTRLDTGGQNIIPFIVRDDEDPSDITFQTSDTTWQAYNWWGGYNLYGGVDDPGHAGRADAVSYNRPIITRDGGYSAGPQDFIFGAEYPAIRWLEQNGYDVNYISGIDTARDGAQLLNSKIFLSVGHDEYWSADQRANVEAARDAGVNLAFLSGNEVYWEVRWENSIDGSGTPYKTLVSYKETWANADIDPGNTTGTWRDPQYGAGQPENALTGTIFTVDSYRLDTIQIPYDLSQFRFWNNTAVAGIQPGQTYSLTPNLLGYEWDSDLDNGFRPAGLIQLSSTTVDVDTLLLDNGNTTGPGTSTHSLTLYRDPTSGAIVFGAGTVYWTWGLDSHHDNETTPTDPNVQQAMVNLFADMGVQPETLMASLAIASQTSDHAAPTSAITSPLASGSYTAAQPIVITGTAVDSGGGSVAVVEVSTDGGTSWHRATGYENWSYEWTPLAGGTYNILSRAVDDSVNMETHGAGTTITVAPAPTTTLFSTSDVPAILTDSDVGFVNLGVRFTSSQAGTIVGMRYYKGLGDGGTHTGSLWSISGTLLATATFTQESASGWQTVTFDNPVSIAAGTTYVASYHSNGHYADTLDYFTTAHANGPLTAPAGNGYYTYSTDNAFPTTASGEANYWVDVIFSPVTPPNWRPSAPKTTVPRHTRNAANLLRAPVGERSDSKGDCYLQPCQHRQPAARRHQRQRLHRHTRYGCDIYCGAAVGERQRSKRRHLDDQRGRVRLERYRKLQ